MPPQDAPQPSRTAHTMSEAESSKVGFGSAVPQAPASPGRLWTGRVLGPVLGVLAYFALPAHEQLTIEGRTAAAIAIVMAVWWMTEAIPLAATALLPIVAFPLLDVVPIADATAPYASPTIFLFMGGFMIALAMQKWGLHKRIALHTVRIVGTHPKQIVLGMMIATAFLSMWVSNTATTLMMLPIAISVLALVTSGTDPGEEKNVRNFAVCLMLAIAYAASVGGLATIIGSPPNAIMVGFVDENYGITISFAEWMRIGVPIAVVFLIIVWLLLTYVIYPTKIKQIMGGKEMIHDRIHELGPMSRGEWNVLVVFVVTALLWVFRDLLADFDALTTVLPFMANLSDAGIAIAAAVVLFLLPARDTRTPENSAADSATADGGDDRRKFHHGTLDWHTVQSGLPWGVLILFGGGLSLAGAVQDTGLDEYIGTQVGGLGALPIVFLVAGTCAIVLLLTELTSNTATAATFLPVLGGVALGLGMDPMLLLLPAVLAASCAFMLPVATPPNAIVFGSGQVTIGQMIRAGIWLNIVGVMLITVAVFALGSWAMGISF
ncbi:DASS family sodium-coupled anion symporter [Hoyosella sp. YIM 151337]|uniref:SLC13 family permease n=1 Tax=Hoyosella sp. YIM 151337 TaxID=2992742 RepID=UPI002235F4D6|nr:DASS family sodium-coupled anion symporter [Hoyosella sp. YIM 151337]MCW4353858.1 DASS family sodium-coupled anion symporter [Hoyosella sp. YIM 151337]